MSYTAKAQNELLAGDVKVGDKITLSDGSVWYVGANEISNASFDMNPADNNNEIVGWHVGTYAQMTTANFDWHATGGYDGGAYIQAKSHTGVAGTGSIGQRWNLETDTRYYFSFYLAKNSANNQYIPVVTITYNESQKAGDNESGAGVKQLLGMNGDASDDILGYGNYNNGEWCQTACSFESEEYTYLQFNARWLKENSIQACFDGFFLAKLYDVETTTPETVAYIALKAKIEELYNAAGDYSEYGAIAEEVSDFAMEGEVNGELIEEMNEKTDLATLQAAIDAIDAKLDAAKAAVANIEAFNALFEEATQLLESELNYPGQDAFESSCEEFQNYIDEGYFSPTVGVLASEYVTIAISELQKAMNDYRFSQVATKETPADYTFLVQSPYFTTKSAAPSITYAEDGSIKSCQYPNDGAYTDGSVPADGSREGWEIAGTTEGDQRLNYKGERICWNAWRTNNQDVAVEQALTKLPNGIYTVSAEMSAEPAYLSNQHIYATSNVQEAVSPILTSGNWNAGEWEYLTTEQVLVVDGKLNIGAIGSAREKEDGSGLTTDQTGWFCVTNFRLLYYGEASEEDIEKAIGSKFAEAEAMADTLHFAGDKAYVLKAIAEAKAAANLDSLNTAIAFAQASEAEYAGIMAGTYTALQDSIEKQVYTGNALKLISVPVNYMTSYLKAEDATYKKASTVTPILRYYRDTLIPALLNAEAYIDSVSAQNGKDAITSTIASVLENLSAYTDNTKKLEAQVEALNKSIAVAKTADIKIEDGADVTAYIVNPTVDDTYASGWTFIKKVGDGNGAKNGQHYDGNANGFYMDTWNKDGGTRATWYQVLNVPNGTYTIKNMMRTSGAGAYLFASDKELATTDNDVVTLDPTANSVLSEMKVIGTNVTKYIDSTVKAADGTDSIAYNTDTYGKIWMDAIDALIASGANWIMLGDPSYKIYDQIEDKRVEDFDPTPEQEELITIIEVNNGIGRGWQYNTVTIEVTNHVLVLGITCDYEFVNKTAEEAFNGTWFSGDTFTLTLDKVGDNTGWDVTTGVTEVETPAEAQPAVIYSISGARLNGLQKGINIIKHADGTTTKVLVK